MSPSQTERKRALGHELAKLRFARLYREQGRAMLAYALRRVDDPEDAADVVAETFLVAWRRLDEVPFGGSERLWLYAVTRRVTANLRRAQGRRTRLAERLAESLRSEPLNNQAASGEAAATLRAMGELREEDRELLLLISWEELSPGEAAKVLGISSLAARSRLHRARRRLRAAGGTRNGAERQNGTRDGGNEMNTRELETALVAADPVDRARLDGLDLEAMEAELLVDLDDERPVSTPEGLAPPRRRRGRALTLGAAVVAAVVVAVVLLSGGGDRPSSAYGADLVRFAESTPLLLLEGPGWRVQNVDELKGRDGLEGSMEFVTGKPIPYESILITGDNEEPRESGMFPPAVRQRRVELSWRRGSLAEAILTARGTPHPHGQRWIEVPVLGTTAQVDTRAEFYVNQGGAGNRQMTAFWSEDGYLLELSAAVPDQAAFEERLDWLTKVNSQTWLDAMPAKVVKAADHDAAVRKMLRGIPVPSTFSPSRVPNTGLTTNRYQVGAAVTGTVSCLWLRQWGEARRSGDKAAEAEAVEAMATSRHWPILREMDADGAYPEAIWEIADDMRQGYWEWNGHRHPVLPRAEGLGCAYLGVPVGR
jgi:RNA polymerase sigma-70 factor (ECF subfamily)